MALQRYNASADARARAQLATGDGSIVIFDPLLGRTLVTLRRAHAGGGGVTAAAFSPCGRLLASGGADCCVRLWGWEEGRLLACFSGAHAQPPTALHWSPCGRLLAAGGRDEAPRVWRTSCA